MVDDLRCDDVESHLQAMVREMVQRYMSRMVVMVIGVSLTMSQRMVRARVRVGQMDCFRVGGLVKCYATIQRHLQRVNEIVDDSSCGVLQHRPIAPLRYGSFGGIRVTRDDSVEVEIPLS